MVRAGGKTRSASTKAVAAEKKTKKKTHATAKSAVSKPARDDFTDYLVDALAELGPVDTKRFFSGVGLALDGVQFAFVIRGALYMRVNETGRDAFLAAGSQPFTYRTSKREVALTGYYAVPASMLEDSDELCLWSRRAFQIALGDREMKTARATRRGAAGT